MAAAIAGVRADPDPAPAVAIDVPGDLWVLIGDHLSDTDRLALSRTTKSARVALSRPFEQERLFHELALSLIHSEGDDDGAWLNLFEAHLDLIRFPDLPSDFPQPILDVIDACLDALPPVAPHPFIDRLRSRYPPRLRRLWPNVGQVARALSHADECVKFLRRPAIIAQLYAYGILFHESDLFAGPVTAAMKAALVPYGYNTRHTYPYRMIAVLHQVGDHRLLRELLQDRAYLRACRQSLYGVVVGLGLLVPKVTPDLFRELVTLPTVAALLAHPERGGRCDANLLEAVAEHGRLQDLAPILLTETAVACRPYAKVTHSLLSMLPWTSSAIVDFVSLRRFARFRTYMDDDLDAFFAHVLNARAQLPDLLRCPQVVDVLVDGRSSRTGRTFMHHLVVCHDYGAIRLLLERTPALFRTADEAARSALSYLTLSRLDEFVDCLPEPKSKSLDRFRRPDLVDLLSASGHLLDEASFTATVRRLDPKLLRDVRVPRTSRNPLRWLRR